jgi:hypothetical protein
MNEQKKLEIIFAAGVLGTLAFKKGLQNIPALDRDLDKYLEEIQNIEGAILLALKSWIKNWNLAFKFQDINKQIKNQYGSI